MLYSSLLLPLLATPALAAHVARNPKRNHGHADIAARNAEVLIEARGPSPELRKPKTKRVVKKKRAEGSLCVVPGTNTTTQIGGGAWAGPTSTASGSATASPSATNSASNPSSSTAWSLDEAWQGNTFFDNFDFWAWNDPTHGTVSYQGASNAWNQGLISINNKGNAIMTVDQTEHVSGGRKAVRIHGKKRYTGGMVIMDAVHAPTGCGTWPAWWMNGDNWPYGGEIDIMEGVNAFSQNQISIHTGSGCRIPSNSNDLQTGSLTTGWFDSYNCAAYETGNEGCGVRDLTNQGSFGEGFNAAGGGVYALEWTQAGIRVWFFSRNNIPSDITNDSPDPASWGKPTANFRGDTCDPYKFFTENFNIFTNTFCGDWSGADSVWNSAGYAGQTESCASKTGYSTCSDYVLNKGSAFSEAYWEVSYVKYFNPPSSS